MSTLTFQSRRSSIPRPNDAFFLGTPKDLKPIMFRTVIFVSQTIYLDERPPTAYIQVAEPQPLFLDSSGDDY